MGGPGSGRKKCASAKRETDDFRQLDIRMLHRDRVFDAPGIGRVRWMHKETCRGEIGYHADTEGLTLDYFYSRPGRDSERILLSVSLEWSYCNFGGRRPWFICPGDGCGRRVATLYGGRLFLCRHCLRLSYKSRKENKIDRAVRRAEYLRDRLGWPIGILTPDGGKPKGMHAKTFARLRREQEYYRQTAMVGLAKRLGLALNSQAIKR